LCRGYPDEFNVFLTYCRNLKFDERPDYNYLRKILRDMMHRNGWDYDNQYDWVIKKAGGTLDPALFHDIAQMGGGNVVHAQGKKPPL